MVFIKELSLRNFKSFKSVDIKLSPGLICLAGPNGSGKSNVTDAVRFALGEMSLKQLRPEGKKASGLIRRGSSHAVVGVVFGGEAGLEIKRAIREDGKMAYRLDGKRATRTSVVESLRKVGAEVGEHNVIAQGEVDRVVKMNAKERREIIDRASGVYEFEEKKKEALSELNKVESRISEANIAIGEREGVLSELEKQKDEALRYAELSKELKRAKGTLIHAEMIRLEKEFEGSAKKAADLQAKFDALQHELEGLEAKLEGLESERSKIASIINEQAGKEGLREELERLRTEIESNSRLRVEKERQVGELRKSIAAQDVELKSFETKMVNALKEAGESEKQAKALAGEIAAGEKERSHVLSGAGGKRAAELRKRHSELLRQMEEKKGAALESESAAVRDSEIAKLKEEELALIAGELGEGNGRAAELESQLGELNGKLAIFAKEEDDIFEREKEINKRLPDYDRRILEIGNKLPEMRMVSGKRPAVDAVISASKAGQLEGIVGTVSDSCTFEEKYALAIEASAGPRLHYILTEDADAAMDAIEHLKKTKAGRCSFIPLDRKISNLPPEAMQFEKSQGVLGFLINLVQFDKRHLNALHYVFGDTLLVKDSETAKRLTGKVRTVTMDGELFERSGIITGGPFGSGSSLKSRIELERLEKQMDEVQTAKKAALAELYSSRDSLGQRRREKSGLEVKARGLEIELEGMRVQGERKKGLVQKRSQFENDLQNLKSAITENQKTAGEFREALSRIESELASISKMLDSQEVPEEKAEELALIEGKITELGDKRRGLDNLASSKKAEVKMLEENMAKGEGELEVARASLKELLGAIEQMRKIVEADGGLLKEKEEKMKEASSKMASLYEQQTKMGAEVEKYSKEKGKAQFNFTRVSNELVEMKSTRQMHEMRLGDLKAEWAEYKEIETMQLSKDELEDRMKQVEGELNAMGMVNMLAPEQYEQKSAELKEKKEIIGKLSEEKKAVLSMIEEIDSRKAEIFLQTFRAVDENFRKIFNYALPGEGMLLLDNPDDIFDSGLQIKVRVDGKDHYIEAKSGGERSLLALLFVFALHSTRPSSFYVLDEADAALDKENSKKLADMLKQLSKKAQFIVVTHNDTVLSAADIALGVTRQDGVSKIVGIEFKKMATASASAPAG
ncbi:MAG: chromosome segregation SMC family protein [Candidatus Burarchaeum sp.]|nr:chromosome segregation SMC family protein [Candidatus Burarchaeum sp.]MDO8339498.1 chromosome segregation SMC family protein [Candidatus Burarchaeum sp.]